MKYRVSLTLNYRDIEAVKEFERYATNEVGLMASLAIVITPMAASVIEHKTGIKPVLTLHDWQMAYVDSMPTVIGNTSVVFEMMTFGSSTLIYGSLFVSEEAE